jgi:hypothetical protein
MTNSLSLIEQIDELPYASLPVIDDMRATNSQLNQVTNDILTLWQASGAAATKVNLTAVLIKKPAHFFAKPTDDNKRNIKTSSNR